MGYHKAGPWTRHTQDRPPPDGRLRPAAPSALAGSRAEPRRHRDKVAQPRRGGATPPLPPLQPEPTQHCASQTPPGRLHAAVSQLLTWRQSCLSCCSVALYPVAQAASCYRQQWTPRCFQQADLPTPDTASHSSPSHGCSPRAPGAGLGELCGAPEEGPSDHQEEGAQ